MNTLPVMRIAGNGDNDDGMSTMKEFQMPGGMGTSKPVTMVKSNPVNMNPELNVKDACPDCFGMGRGSDGAC
jgi:hypothetical protein